MFGGGGASKSSMNTAELFARISGQQQFGAAQEEAGYMRDEANTMFWETMQEQARVAREADLYIGDAKHTYISNGVLTSSGSPAAFLETARQLKEQELESIKRRGNAMVELRRRQAWQVERSGFEGLLSTEMNIFNRREQYREQLTQQKNALFGGLLNTGIKTAFSLFGG